MEGYIYKNSTDRQNHSPMKEKRMNSKDTSSVAEQEDVDDLLGGGADYDRRKRAATGGAVGKRGSAGGGGGSAMKTCQAERCSADLNEAKSYHRRHKVCEHHFKAQAVVVAGIRQRFCQQCSRFHELSEFDEAKRSCRRRLACHNERRRKNFADNNDNSEATTDVAATGYRQVADRGGIQFAIQESANYG